MVNHGDQPPLIGRVIPALGNHGVGANDNPIGAFAGFWVQQGRHLLPGQQHRGSFLRLGQPLTVPRLLSKRGVQFLNQVLTGFTGRNGQDQQLPGATQGQHVDRFIDHRGGLPRTRRPVNSKNISLRQGLQQGGVGRFGVAFLGIRPDLHRQSVRRPERHGLAQQRAPRVKQRVVFLPTGFLQPGKGLGIGPDPNPARVPGNAEQAIDRDLSGAGFTKRPPGNGRAAQFVIVWRLFVVQLATAPGFPQVKTLIRPTGRMVQGHPDP